MAKCEQCKKEYEAKRSTSRYCGAKCRKLAFRKNGKVSVPEVSVPAYSEDQAKLIVLHKAEDDLDEFLEKMVLPCPEKWWGIDDHAAWIRWNKPEWIPEGYKTEAELEPGQHNIPPLPGNADYVGVCSDVERFASRRINR